jgi:hypothetical protein
MQNNNKFLIQSKSIAIAISLTNWAAWKFLAATTAVFSYAMLGEFLRAYLQGAWFYAGLAAGTLLVYFLVDAGLTEMLRWAFQIKGTQMNKAERAFSNFIVVLVVFKVCATMTSSLWAAPEMADAITSDDGQKQAIALLLQADSAQHRSLQQATDHLRRMEDTEAQRLQQARTEGGRIVEGAIATGNKWQRNSYRSIGFSWLLSPANKDRNDHAYAARIQAAQARATTLFDEARHRTTTAAAAVQAIGTDTTHQRKIGLLADVAEDEGASIKEKKNRRRGYIWLADILATLLGLFCTYLLALREKAGGVPLRAKTVASIFGTWADRSHDSFLAWLESILGVDIDGNGEIGTVGNTTPTGPTALENTGPKTIGFQMPQTAQTVVKQQFQPKQQVVVNTDLTYLKQLAALHYRRALISEGEDARRNNYLKYLEEKQALEALGVIVVEHGSNGLKFHTREGNKED